MAFLIRLARILALSVSLSPLFLIGMPVEAVDSPHVFEGARRSLEHCDWSRSSHWARELERIDSDHASLYRLAWTETPRGIPSSLRSFGAREQWVWPWDGEIWSDEQLQVSENWTCGSTPPSEPDPIRKSILSPLVSRYANLRPSLRTAVRWAMIKAWSEGDKRWSDLPPLPSGLPTIEKCHWHAFQLLFSTTTENPNWSNWLDECDAIQPSEKLDRDFLTQMEIAAADHLLTSDKSTAQTATRAFEIYRKVLTTFSSEPHSNDPGMWFRLAVAASQSASNDDLFLRATSRAIHPVEGSAPIAPVFQAALYNQFCDRIIEIEPAKSVELARTVFPPGERATAFTELLSHCSSPEHARHILKIADRLKPQGTRLPPRDQIKIAQLAFSASLTDGNLTSAKVHAAEIVRLGPELPALAKHAFWASLESPGIHPGQLTDIASLVRKKNAFWEEQDEARLQRLIRRRSEKGSESVEGLRPDQKTASQPLRLRLSLSLPEPRWRPDFSISFKGLYLRDLAGHGKSGEPAK